MLLKGPWRGSYVLLWSRDNGGRSNFYFRNSIYIVDKSFKHGVPGRSILIEKVENHSSSLLCSQHPLFCWWWSLDPERNETDGVHCPSCRRHQPQDLLVPCLRFQGKTQGALTEAPGYMKLPVGLQHYHSLMTYCVLGTVLGDSYTSSHLILRAIQKDSDEENRAQGVK